MEDNSVLNFFYDVPNDAYYYEAVKWAAENGITGGVGNSLFAPNQPCNRAQIVTFLWRAAGSPVVNYLMPFTDVDEGAYLCRGSPLGGEHRHRHRSDGDDLRHRQRLHPRAGCGHDLPLRSGAG